MFNNDPTEATMHEEKLDKDLKPLTSQFNLNLLQNKDKNMHVRAISSTLIEKGLASVTTIIETMFQGRMLQWRVETLSPINLLVIVHCPACHSKRLASDFYCFKGG